MRINHHAAFWLAVLLAWTAEVRPDSPKNSTPPPVNADQAAKVINRGLDFLIKDAAKWRKDRECATCHHGTLTVWALWEAKSRGYDVPKDTLADVVKWTKDRWMARVDGPRDKRPGWSMVSTPAIYLAQLALAVPKQDAVNADDLKRIVGHLLRHQEEDGSWAWSSAPPKNRPPPFFESDELATLLTYSALRPHIPADPTEKSPVRDARQRAAAWLKKTAPNDTTQAAAIRLLVQVRDGLPATDLRPEIDRFVARRNPDGGWGQLKGAASDGYATGQALFVLNVAGVRNDRPEIRRAVAFLIATQKEDGSWPMIPRAHPGATPAKNIVPITYFGSAWAMIGLVRSAAK